MGLAVHLEGLSLLTADPNLAQYDIPIVWRARVRVRPIGQAEGFAFTGVKEP